MCFINCSSVQSVAEHPKTTKNNKTATVYNIIQKARLATSQRNAEFYHRQYSLQATSATVIMLSNKSFHSNIDGWALKNKKMWVCKSMLSATSVIPFPQTPD